MNPTQIFTFIIDVAAGGVLGANVIIFLRLRRLYRQILETRKILEETKRVMEAAIRDALAREGRATDVSSLFTEQPGVLH